jgi:hypothetical protein
MSTNTNNIQQQPPIVQKLANANEQAWLTLGEFMGKKERYIYIYITHKNIYMLEACRSL